MTGRHLSTEICTTKAILEDGITKFALLEYEMAEQLTNEAAVTAEFVKSVVEFKAKTDYLLTS